MSQQVLTLRYRLERLLGQGGMGRVYLARHIELGERVALKVLRDEHSSKDAPERLRREARAVARMRGENVARVMDAGVSSDHGPFLVMEYVDGQSLAALLETNGPLSVERASQLVLQACVGLAEAHALGIIHRDIKPSNLLLTHRPDGTELLKVVDFGIAKAEALAATTLTDTSNLLGSPKYMSPEQLREASTVDARTDVWSLGVVLYELLTGHLPFEAYTAAGVLSRVAADDPTPPRAVRPDLSEACEAVVLKALEKDPEKRHSITELAAELAPLAGEDGPALASRVERIAAERRRWSDHPTEASPSTQETLDASADEDAPVASEQTRTSGRARAPFPPVGARWIAWSGRAALVSLVLVAGGWLALHSSATVGAAPPVGPTAPPTSTTLALFTSAAPALSAALERDVRPASVTTHAATQAVVAAPIRQRDAAADLDEAFGPRK